MERVCEALYVFYVVAFFCVCVHPPINRHLENHGWKWMTCRWKKQWYLPFAKLCIKNNVNTTIAKDFRPTNIYPDHYIEMSLIMRKHCERQNTKGYSIHSVSVKPCAGGKRKKKKLKSSAIAKELNIRWVRKENELHPRPQLPLQITRSIMESDCQ